jgi:hypothetical protein
MGILTEVYESNFLVDERNGKYYNAKWIMLQLKLYILSKSYNLKHCPHFDSSIINYQPAAKFSKCCS